MDPLTAPFAVETFELFIFIV